MVPFLALTTETGRWSGGAARPVPAFLLLVVAVWEIVVIARAGSNVPGAADWDRASAALRQRHQPGDLIVFAPDWIDPIGRLHLGDLISLDMAGRMDAARYGVIWELSIRGARAPETRGLTPESEARFGRLTMRRFVRDPAIVVTDFVADFRSARHRGSAVVDFQEVGFEPHRCILARPAPGGTVTVTFSGVTLGSRLVAYAGLADVFTRRDDRQPGRLAVTIDGTEVATRTFGVDDGWVRLSADTSPATDATVVFTATAVGPHARNRLICFAAEARR